MTMKERLCVAIYETQQILDTLGIEYSVSEVDINHKAKSYWGSCVYDRSTGKYRIEISSDLLLDGINKYALLNTVIHEFLHAHKDRMKHTGEWKRCAQLVNMKYPYLNVKRTTSSKEVGLDNTQIENRYSGYHYKITCNKCGATVYMKRKTKMVKLLMDVPNSCKCKKCGNTVFTVDHI